MKWGNLYFLKVNGDIHSGDEITNLSAGEYNVQATDASGCVSLVQNYVLSQPPRK